MIVKVRKIGNSTGIILSKSILEQCAIKDEVSIEVKDETIIIQSIKKKPREGWAEQFITAGSLTDYANLIPSFESDFDKEEWTW